METRIENLYTEDCIRTYTGIYINVFEPTAEMINIEDIAHSLANQCRFGGHLPYFYSVAQHSANCAALVPDEHKLAALLHDASEAYLMDIPRPIKKRLPDYKTIEDKLMKVIAAKFGFAYPLVAEIKSADEVMLQSEWNCLMLGKDEGFEYMGFNRAKEYFLTIYNAYQSSIKDTTTLTNKIK